MSYLWSITWFAAEGRTRWPAHAGRKPEAIPFFSALRGSAALLPELSRPEHRISDELPLYRFCCSLGISCGVIQYIRFRLEIGAVVVLLFVGCIGSLIGSLVVFIADINLSLSALKLEISANDNSAIDGAQKARR